MLSDESRTDRSFIWDGENVRDEISAADTLLAVYTLAPRGYGDVIAMRRNNATSFHHYDALGSTERLTDSSENALASYLYRAFGEQSVLSGSSANPFTWVGRLGYYRQGDTGNYWLRARVHQPGIGRFLSLDPLRQEVNRYLYAKNRPLVLVDASGREAEDETSLRCRWIGPGAGARERTGPGPRGRWRCRCPEEEQKGWSCEVKPPPGPGWSPRAEVEPTSIVCNCRDEESPYCKVTLRRTVTRQSGREEVVIFGPKEGRCVRTRPVGGGIGGPAGPGGPGGGGPGVHGGGGGGGWPGAGAGGGGGFGGGNGGGGGGGHTEDKGTIWFWAGDVPRRAFILLNIQLSAMLLQERGYNAGVERSGSAVALKSINTERDLIGLFAASHGFCADWNPLPGSGCATTDFNKQEIMVGPTWDDWMPVSQPARFRRFTPCHCTIDPENEFGGAAVSRETAVGWYASALELSATKVEFCPLLHGFATTASVLIALELFEDVFP